MSFAHLLGALSFSLSPCTAMPMRRTLTYNAKIAGSKPGLRGYGLCGHVECDRPVFQEEKWQWPRV